MQTLRRSCSLMAMLGLLASTLDAGTLTLSAEFVKKVKNTATLPIHLQVDAHLTKAHTIGRSGDDGDIRMAGRADEVKLPLVAEIMNAGVPAQAADVDKIDSSSPGDSFEVTGVWRIWFEHPSPGDQIQGDTVEIPANSNPDHIFEIHPITNFDKDEIGKTSLVQIEKNGKTYEAYPASTAFPAYEKLRATISGADNAITITSPKAGYNYAEFVMELAGKATKGDNGFFALANVFDVADPETPVTADVRRMVFAENTDPADQVQRLPKGGRLHVLGIPRVNLAEVEAIATGDAVDTLLPYEMVIVAVLPDADATSESASGGTVAESPKKRSSPTKRN
jgi:hypothetical protein